MAFHKRSRKFSGGAGLRCEEIAFKYQHFYAGYEFGNGNALKHAIFTFTRDADDRIRTAPEVRNADFLGRANDRFNFNCFHGVID